VDQVAGVSAAGEMQVRSAAPFAWAMGLAGWLLAMSLFA